MRLGKLPENIYSRSVDKRIRTHNNKLKGAAIRDDCAFLCAEGIQLKADKTAGKNYCREADKAVGKSAYGEQIDILFRYAFFKAAAVAGKPATMQAQIILPVEVEEKDLRELVELITNCAFKYKLTVSAVDVRSLNEVKSIQLNLILLGLRESVVNPFSTKKKKQADQLVYVGRTAAAGTALLATEYFNELADRYSSDYVRRMTETYDETVKASPIERIPECAAKYSEIYPVGEGGVFAALWNLGSEYDCGLRVELKKIPIFQETVELCDFFDINPYMLDSRGDCLLLTDEADKLVEELNEMRVEASFIGFLTENNDRVIINNDEERFLTAPESDEVYRATTHRK